MKKIPQLHFVQFPVTVLKLHGYKSGTWKKAKLQRIQASTPSYTWWNCYLISSLRGGIA